MMKHIGLVVPALVTMIPMPFVNVGTHVIDEEVHAPRVPCGRHDVPTLLCHDQLPEAWLGEKQKARPRRRRLKDQRGPCSLKSRDLKLPSNAKANLTRWIWGELILSNGAVRISPSPAGFNSPAGIPTYCLWFNGKNPSRANRLRPRPSCARY